MNIIEVCMLGLALGMDVFAVAVCKGLSMKKINLNKVIIIGIYLGSFHVIMPLIGYFLGQSLSYTILSADHWIAFGLLNYIGIKMIWEAVKETDKLNDLVNMKTMLPLALATSIDALAIGVTFSIEEINIIMPVIIIGIIAVLASAVGVIIGNKFGTKYASRAEVFGGVILITMGIRILFEHLS